jgi:hypothetical protein
MSFVFPIDGEIKTVLRDECIEKYKYEDGRLARDRSVGRTNEDGRFI